MNHAAVTRAFHLPAQMADSRPHLTTQLSPVLAGVIGALTTPCATQNATLGMAYSPFWKYYLGLGLANPILDNASNFDYKPSWGGTTYLTTPHDTKAKYYLLIV